MTEMKSYYRNQKMILLQAFPLTIIVDLDTCKIELPISKFYLHLAKKQLRINESCRRYLKENGQKTQMTKTDDEAIYR